MTQNFMLCGKNIMFAWHNIDMKSSLVVVYGRRRLGKSTLIN